MRFEDGVNWFWYSHQGRQGSEAVSERRLCFPLFAPVKFCAVGGARLFVRL